MCFQALALRRETILQVDGFRLRRAAATRYIDFCRSPYVDRERRYISRISRSMALARDLIV